MSAINNYPTLDLEKRIERLEKLFYFLYKGQGVRVNKSPNDGRHYVYGLTYLELDEMRDILENINNEVKTNEHN